MTDYLPLLSRAVANLKNNPEARRKVYDRARSALLTQLRTMNPPLAEAEITRERLALEEAIRRLDQDAAKVEVPVPVQVAAPAGSGVRSAPMPRKPGPPQPSPSSAPVPGARRPPAAPPPMPQVSASERLAEPASPNKSMRDAGAVGGQPAEPRAEIPAPSRDSSAAAPSLPEQVGDEVESAIDPRNRVRSAPPIGEPVQRRPVRGRGAVDYAKADAEKARKAKMIVGGIVGALIAAAILIGYVHRDRILASFGLSAPVQRAATKPGDTARSSDRIAPTPQAKGSGLGQTAGGNVAATVAQRSVLYEEDPTASEQKLQTFVGTAVWRTETVNPGPGRPPELGLRVEVEVPDRKMSVAISIRRNPDQTLPASHTIEVQFQTPNDPFGGVANLPGIRAKTTETAQGAPLVGLVVRVMPGFFLVGLSAIDADREQNLLLLRERGWLDVPFVYNNGRRAVLVIEKGTPGERAVNEVIASWGG